MKDKIRENAKKYFEEELSGEPLYQDLVIDWLSEFAQEQVKLFAIPDVSGSLPLASPEKIFERLVELYPDNYACVGKICDEVLDRSGALLGKVRNKARQ